MSDESLWRDRFYRAYVSSGQASIRSDDLNRNYLSRQPYIRRVIEQHVPKDRDTRIVDLGCGAGMLFRSLREMGYKHLAGVDVSAEMVEIAIKQSDAKVELGEIQPYLERLPDRSVDVVFLMDVLEHLTRDELLRLLDQVNRVLARPGRVIAHVPNGSAIHSGMVRYGDITHELAFTPGSLRQVFNVCGFNSVTCFEDKPVPHGLKSMVRRVLWEVLTIPHRLLRMAETGNTKAILSQNLLVVAVVDR
jgi:SAM-dependent methyltransferase